MYEISVTDKGDFDKLLEELFPVPRRGLDSLYEQVAANECKNSKSPLQLGTNHDAKKAVLYHPRCGLWSCPVCAQINQMLWTWRAAIGGREMAEKYGYCSFLTLTSHEKLDADASTDVWPDAWDKLRKRAGRAAGKVEYFAVPERHRTGRLHVHAIVATAEKLPKRWWKNAARACGMGYQADLQEVIHEGGVGGYVGKYLAKTLHVSNWPRGFHRVRTSRGWPKLPPLPPPEGWNFQTLGRSDYSTNWIDKFRDAGWEILYGGSNAAWEYIKNATE